MNLRSVAALIVRRDDLEEPRYLIVAKPRDNHIWQFPQGGVDEGETLKQAALRELQEECGEAVQVKIKGERPVGTYEYLFPKDFIRPDHAFSGAQVSFFVADWIEGEILVDGTELVGSLWATDKQIQMMFDDSYFKVIQSFYG